MLQRYWFVLFFFLFLSDGAIAQNAPGKDSLIFKKATNAFELAFRNSDSALLLGNEALREAVAMNNNKAEANAYNSIGWAYMHKGHLDSSIILLNRARSLFSKENDDFDITRVDINLAEVYTKQNQLADAIQYLIQADSLSARIKDLTLQTDVKRQLAIVYREAGDNKKSAEYFNEAIQGFEKQGDYYRYVNTGVSLSILYRNMNLPDSSLFILDRCFNIARDRGGTKYQVAMIEENIGETHFATGNYANALDHYKAAYNTFKKLDNKADLAFESFCVGKTLSQLKRPHEAEKYLLVSYNINDSLGMKNYQLDASNELASLYKANGNWEKAYQFLHKATELRDTLQLSEQVEKANELKVKFETEKREHEIEILKAHNQLMKWRYLLGILATLVSGSFVWIYNSRKKIREEKILNYFATSLYNQNTVEDVFWDIAKNCISQLNFEDCVIYGYDESRKVLVQKAAFGPKNPDGHTISNLLEIPVGKGIVGYVAKSLTPEIIKDTKKDQRYLVDDESRNAEITVPIIVDGKLLGIIDSENSHVGFFTKKHLKILQKIADTCSKKVTRNFVEEGLRKKLASDLHDDIGSNLSSINIISKVALLQPGIADQLKQHLASIKDYSLNMMENMSDMVWAINPGNDNVDSLVSKMKEWAAEICEPRQIILHFEVSQRLDNMLLDAEKRKHLFLIFKEALNNAAKYSECRNIHIKIREAAHHNIGFSIQDDGVGFQLQNHKIGNGLMNMQTRADQLNAELKIFSGPGLGTTLELISRNVIPS